MSKTPPEAPTTPRSEGILIDFWAAVFKALGKISVLELLRWKFEFAHKRNFIDLWVAGHCALALGCFYIATLNWDDDSTWILQLTVVFAVFRVLEIFCTQVNVLLFDHYRKWRRHEPYSIYGLRRMVVLIAHNYWEMIAWFGTIYVYLHRVGTLSVEIPETFRFFSLLRQSMLMMLSYNAEDLKAASSLGVAILSLQSIVGLVLTVVIFARFLSLLPTPDSYAEKATAAQAGLKPEHAKAPKP